MANEEIIMGCWNAGLTLSQAAKRCMSRHNISSAELISVWRKLRRKYGCASIPLSNLRGFKVKEPTDPAYRIWKGLDGPGALLRKIIAAH